MTSLLSLPVPLDGHYEQFDRILPTIDRPLSMLSKVFSRPGLAELEEEDLRQHGLMTLWELTLRYGFSDDFAVRNRFPRCFRYRIGNIFGSVFAKKRRGSVDALHPIHLILPELGEGEGMRVGISQEALLIHADQDLFARLTVGEALEALDPGDQLVAVLILCGKGAGEPRVSIPRAIARALGIPEAAAAESAARVRDAVVNSLQGGAPVGRPKKDSVERHGFACSPFAARIVDSVQTRVSKVCGPQGVGVVPRSWYLNFTANGEKVLALWYPAKSEVVEVAVPYVSPALSVKLRNLSPQFQQKKTGLHVVVPVAAEKALLALVPQLVKEALARAEKVLSDPPKAGRGRPRKLVTP